MSASKTTTKPRSSGTSKRQIAAKAATAKSGRMDSKDVVSQTRAMLKDIQIRGAELSARIEALLQRTR